VEGVDGGWTSQYAIRAYYWPDRPYNVLEVYAPDGRLVEIYVNISSPAVIGHSRVSFTDYELDVSRRPPDTARLEDEDEFREAASRYDYSDAFQKTCYRLAGEAIKLANNWVALGLPATEAARGESE
jgi:protein associated with RNAse G/E